MENIDLELPSPPCHWKKLEMKLTMHLRAASLGEGDTNMWSRVAEGVILPSATAERLIYG